MKHAWVSFINVSSKTHADVLAGRFYQTWGNKLWSLMNRKLYPPRNILVLHWLILDWQFITWSRSHLPSGRNCPQFGIDWASFHGGPVSEVFLLILLCPQFWYSGEKRRRVCEESLGADERRGWYFRPTRVWIQRWWWAWGEVPGCCGRCSRRWGSRTRKIRFCKRNNAGKFVVKNYLGGCRQNIRTAVILVFVLQSRQLLFVGMIYWLSTVSVS